MTWILGSSSQAQTLTSADDLYETHINQLRFSNPPTAVVGTDTNCQYQATGTSDDVAIQAAIDYVNSLGGGWVHIRRGTYNTSSPIKLYSNIKLTGEGWGTILKQSASANLAWIITGSVDGTQYTNISISDLQIDGNYSNQDYSGFSAGAFKGAGIAHNRFSYSRFDNLYIHDCGMYGSFVNYGNDNVYSRCYLEGNLGNISYAVGMFITSVSSYNILVRDCTSTGHFSHGLTFEDRTSKITFLDNNIYSNGGAGLTADGDTIHNDIKIIGNNIYSNTNYGVSLIYSSTLSKNILIKDNIIYSNPTAGIRLGVNKAIISDNFVYNNGRGIECATNGVDYEVTNNHCFDNQTPKIQDYGVTLAATNSRMMVKDNHLYGNLTGALLNQSTATNNIIGPNIDT